MSGRATQSTRSYDAFYRQHEAGEWSRADVEWDVDEECPECDGEGSVEVMGHFGPTTISPPYRDTECDVCEGRGVVLAARCRRCGRFNDCECCPVHLLPPGDPPAGCRCG